MDSQVDPDEGASDRSVFRARELLDALARQAMNEAAMHCFEDEVRLIHTLQQRVQALERHSESRAAGVNCACQTAMDTVLAQVAAMQEKIDLKEYGEQQRCEAEAVRKVNNLAGAISLYCQRLVTLEQQMRVAGVAQSSLPQQDVLTLLNMHTRAISQTWQWVSSTVKVTQQHAAWLHKCTDGLHGFPSPSRPSQAAVDRGFTSGVPIASAGVPAGAASEEMADPGSVSVSVEDGLMVQGLSTDFPRPHSNENVDMVAADAGNIQLSTQRSSRPDDDMLRASDGAGRSDSAFSAPHEGDFQSSAAEDGAQAGTFASPVLLLDSDSE
eukprot:6327195-Amphidinium_carterae.3